MDIRGKGCLEINCKRNINRTVISNSNINSFRNKFDSLIKQIMGTVDILIILKRKLDSSRSAGNFLINGQGELLRINWNNQWGGIM